MRYSKKIVLYVMLCLIVCAMTGCKAKESEKTDKLSVVTTLFPNYDFAKQIGGDKAEVTLLLNPGVEAHDYDPTPADIIKINEADIFVYTGDAMEAWAASIIETVDSKTLQVVDASKNIELAKTEDKSSSNSSEEESGEHEHEHESVYDPHIWTSPKNAIVMVNNILAAYVKADPDNAEYYQKNADAYIQEIQKLDTEIREVVENAEQDTLYFGGRFALLYFAKEYGLGYMAAFDSCSSETEPSAKLVTKIVDAMKQNDAKVVFYEELSDGKAAKAIAEEVGGKTLLLHSCHNVSAEDFEAGATYVSLMKQNIENLKIGLGVSEKK